MLPATRARLCRRPLVICAGLLLGFAACGGKPDMSPLAMDNAQLGLDLYARVAGQTSGNVFVSPYSLQTALAMTYAGARGQTAADMARALHVSLAAEPLCRASAQARKDLAAAGGRGLELGTANALWADQQHVFLDDYVRLIRKEFGADLFNVDFRADAEAARVRINGWVEQQTRDRIKELVPPGALNEMTRLVLVNAVYFKGQWKDRFDARATREGAFFASTGEVKAPLMRRTGRYAYAETADHQVLELPYAGERLAMVVVLPRAKDGLPALAKSLTPEALTGWLAALSEREVRVTLPRFTITVGLDASAVLKDMGMGVAFGDQADFSGMDGTRGLAIGAVLHKAFVEVNEEGTEAAAATAVTMLEKSMPAPAPAFTADHPFLFLIRDRATGLILFLGRLVTI